MKTYIVIIFLEYIFSLIFTREFIVAYTQIDKTNTTPFMAAHFAKQNTKFGGGGKRGRAKIPSPQPPSFLPARAFQFCAQSAQSFRVLLKKCSNFVQKTPPKLKIGIGSRNGVGTKCRHKCIPPKKS